MRDSTAETEARPAAQQPHGRRPPGSQEPRLALRPAPAAPVPPGHSTGVKKAPGQGWEAGLVPRAEKTLRGDFDDASAWRPEGLHQPQSKSSFNSKTPNI